MDPPNVKSRCVRSRWSRTVYRGPDGTLQMDSRTVVQVLCSETSDRIWSDGSSSVRVPFREPVLEIRAGPNRGSGIRRL